MDLVEYEIGMRRCGVKTPEEFYTLAKKISESPNLTFGGYRLTQATWPMKRIIISERQNQKQ
jgi:D-serine deaminase-like pyridoxal phosphate-dependent protein